MSGSRPHLWLLLRTVQHSHQSERLHPKTAGKGLAPGDSPGALLLRFPLSHPALCRISMHHQRQLSVLLLINTFLKPSGRNSALLVHGLGGKLFAAYRATNR